MHSTSRFLAAALFILATPAVAADAGSLASLPRSTNYDQLTPAQKDLVRSSYDALPADDEPPYPVGGMGSLLRPLLYSAHHIQMDGWVDAIADVGPDGVVRSVSVYKSPDPVVITPTMTQLLMLQKFKPGKCKGAPCAMPFALRVNLADN